ncbi:MAG: tRNA pseudouridine(55) synthase TruB [Desulforhabdus sp.]|jgi:tRNA pseudouridine55 synthase|nr:tRNA pseudouridine(55) synthase TruB [Desulforhabdus sp.]
MNNTGINSTTSRAPLEGCSVAFDKQPCPASDSGILILDKPEGMTSFKLTDRTRKLLNLTKAGHCGTLDPFATGVLVVCVNQATRIADQLSLQDKLYQFTMRFGLETDSLDKTGHMVRAYDGPPIGKGELLGALGTFVGRYGQLVPRYAAVKVRGKRLYELARRGIEVDRPTREVEVHSLELLDYRWPEAQIKVHCSKGTYIRQLAADIGRVLNCGAHVSELRRWASGPFDIATAIPLDELERMPQNGGWETKLISMNDALAHLPEVLIRDEMLLQNLYNGHLDPEWKTVSCNQLVSKRGPVRLVTAKKHLAALWWPECLQNEGSKQRTLRVFK